MQRTWLQYLLNITILQNLLKVEEKLNFKEYKYKKS